MVFNGKIGIRMSYLNLKYIRKANKCSCFTSKKWQEGVAKFGNGDIISALVRPADVKIGVEREKKKWAPKGEIPLGNGTARRKRGEIFWRIT